MDLKNSQDVVIVGGGPAASCTALFLQKLGIQSLIVERECFPRYHIGESLTGEVGALLRALDIECHLVDSGYPIKHGVRVYGRDGVNTFWVPVMKRAEDGDLMPAATWQVRRDEFDNYLLQTAIKRGASFLRGNAESVTLQDGVVNGLRVLTKDGVRHEIHSKVLVDASGQGTFLANKGITGPKERGGYERQTAVYGRVRNALRDPGENAGNTLIFYQGKHQWAWFIPLDEETTSIGVVTPGSEFTESNMSPYDFLKCKLKNFNCALSERLEDAELAEDTRTASNYSYHVRNFTGPGFLCVGDSHRFIDPIFSFGVFFATNEARMASHAIREYLSNPTTEYGNPFEEYEALCESGQDVIQDLIDFFWEFPLAFQMMAYKTHPDQITDCFAGRIYQGNRPSEAVATMRRMLSSHRALQQV